MSYFISIAFIFIASILGIAFFGGTIGGTIDVPSLVVTVATIFTVLIASSSVKDFFCGLKIVHSKKEFSALQTANSMNAVSLVIQSLLCMGGLIVFLCLAMLLALWEDKASFGMVMALGLLTVFYAGECLLVLLPVKALLYKKLASCKKSPLQEKIVFSKIPAKPFLTFAVGIVVLFLLLFLMRTFDFSEFSPRLISLVPFMVIFLFGSSYIFLFAAKLFVPYLNAVKIAFACSSSENLKVLSDARRAVNFLILVRFALAAFGAVLFTVGVLCKIEDVSEALFKFSVPLFFVAISFLSVLLLLVTRAKIEKAINFRIYGA